MFGGVSGGWKRLYDWYGDTHPKTEYQYKTQRFLAGAFPGYSNWMRGRAEDEWIQSQRGVLGLDWSDIRNPWIATLSGGNTASAYGSMIGRGADIVSDNIDMLYSDNFRQQRLGESDKAYRRDRTKYYKRRR